MATIHVKLLAGKGTFDNWLKSVGKLGGQNKIPRLSNDRTIMEQIVQFVETSNSETIE